jgi:hypothetical protein
MSATITVLKALMPGKQCGREEACDISCLPDIYPNIQGFVREHGIKMEVWMNFRLAFHDLFPYWSSAS